MIQLVDDYLQYFIVEKLKYLKQHPVLIDRIFRTGKRETLDSLKEFLLNKKVKVIIGFPKETSSLPAYVITVASENEQPSGIGDNLGTYEEDYYGDIEEEETPEVVEKTMSSLVKRIGGTYLNSTYRIECWSDNGDLTAYMYTILKWVLLTSRNQMYELGWVNVSLSGADLEPVPDYMPMFIYRRASQISITYENLYYSNVDAIDTYVKILENPDGYEVDEQGNIVDKEGEIVVPESWTWILNPTYYTKKLTSDDL